MSAAGKRIGVLCGGGPAPGFNGVIGAVALEAARRGMECFGFIEGFKYLMEGKPKFIKLTADNCGWIHFQGGSIICTSRANPTKKPEDLKTVAKVLSDMKLDYLITIGGDDTAYSARCVSESLGGKISVLHVPKTIDNDLPLPGGQPTFGYTTARALGVELVRNLMFDAQTTMRWYVVVAMGRSAGHLSLGIGKSAGAQLTLIPEEFSDGKFSFKEVCDITEGAILKRRAVHDQGHGVIVLAEGLVSDLPEEEANRYFPDLPRDNHGHPRLEFADLEGAVRREIIARFAKRGEKIAMVGKKLGYELRCAPPVAWDQEYTRNLGFAAVNYLLAGETGKMVVIHPSGEPMAISFEDLKDPATGKTRVRRVDIAGLEYTVARNYMTRLVESDFNGKALTNLAKVAQMSEEEFTLQFQYLTRRPFGHDFFKANPAK